MAETYHIATIQDLLKVPPERLRACLDQIELAVHTLQLTTGNKARLPDGITWTDDGDNSVDLQINDESWRLEITKGSEQ